jgi:hypothetical protein
MRKFLTFIIWILLLSALAGCGAAASIPVTTTNLTSNATGPGPATASPTAGDLSIPPISLPAPDNAAGGTVPAGTAPAGTALADSATTSTPDPYLALTNSCGLLNSHDLASLLQTAEVTHTPPQVRSVKQPIFSLDSASARELSCVFYAFHQPGKKTGFMLQVNYWVDLPDSTGRARLSKAWADTQIQAAQPVYGIGDAGIWRNGRLTFKQGEVYVTVETIRTDQDAHTPDGAKLQLETEKQVAQAMLLHLTGSGQ